MEPAAGGERRVGEKSREEPDDPGKRTRRKEQVPGNTREEGPQLPAELLLCADTTGTQDAPGALPSWSFRIRRSAFSFHS